MKAGRAVYGALIVTLSLLAAACGTQQRTNEHASLESQTMKASTTYLYLLRKTPFFTKLSTEQLRWVIAHSREWEAEAGTVVTQCGQDGKGADDVWVLLDGHWDVEHDGRSFSSGHADPGKWFSAQDAGKDCRLVATEHSYVMQIDRGEFDSMLGKGFAFDEHLGAGREYYKTIFGAQPASAR